MSEVALQATNIIAQIIKRSCLFINGRKIADAKDRWSISQNNM